MRKLLQIIRQRCQVGRLALIIQFLQNGGFELGEDFSKTITPADVRMLIKEARDLFKHFKILRNLFADFRALHFHDDRPPIAQRRAMNLPERRGGQMFFLEE